jgi:biopolymer transport protein ExbB
MWIMKSGASSVVLLLLIGLALPGGAAFAQDDRIELDNLLKDRTDALKGEMEKAEPGDKAEFPVTTDDNISSLEIGDIYTNNSTFFRVTGISAKGTTGGKFTVQRMAGKADPGLKWARVSGMGPVSVSGTQTLLDYYRAGGFFMHPIAVMAFFTVILVCNSLWIYRRGRQCPKAFIQEADRLLDKGDIERFEDLSLREKGLLPAICRSLAERFDTSQPEDIKGRCELAAGAQVHRLRIPVKALNLIAAAAPLLGLLGTIVGMVMVFEAVASASGAAKAQALAAGIRVKLFCTAMALCVAIPALFAFFIFNQKLGLIISECELLTERFLHKACLLKRNGAATPAKDAEADDDDDDAPAPAPPPQAARRRAAREDQP